ncbi:surface carbohydrate biosynthesis protein [Gracilibacillus ureilyticus]|uniref:Surface carbohydrate biosynthesis protein n=1 Tax=Gracilibacillus ureilyticus TaxID=531814 RepID=A0A1H9RVX5_9BACI|nr:surface carbohydrate biosynthesis protein [Gracilibacillus ureilyticus]SER76303.1 surface carbohydrate biosynthesis protein [Gracilibacillus ureilyticus]
MKERWLYLPIEVKVRECDAKLLLAYHAVKDDYNVVIGDHPTVEEIGTTYPAGIFFSKGGPHGFRKRVITRAMEHSHKITELDEEGLIFDKQRYLQDRMQKQTLQLVDQEYCWGKHQYETIVRAYPDLKQKLHITGNPRFDLLTPTYRKIYDLERQKLRERYGEFLLVNTRFSQYNTAKGFKQTIHYKHIEKLYYYFIKMIKKVANYYPDRTIIIRPHPGENFASYRKEMSLFSNVHVIHEGNIIPWIYAAQAIIHNGCTSGIEAFLLDQPVISYLPFDTKEPDIPNQSGQMATTEKQVITLIGKILKQQPLPNPPVSQLDYFTWSADSYAFDAILSLCNRISLPPPVNQISKKQAVRRQPFIKRRKRKFTLTEEEIRSFFQKVNKVNETELSCTIKGIGANVFHIAP